jgi:hypothetical protein
VDQSGLDPDGGSFCASINANGRYVAFDSLASDLVSGDGNGFSNVFLRDVITGTTSRGSTDMSRGGQRRYHGSPNQPDGPLPRL